MVNPPMTREEARELRCGKRAGNPKGYDYDESKCAYETAGDFGWGFKQCSRKPGHGPDGLYCKQHAGMVEKGERDA